MDAVAAKKPVTINRWLPYWAVFQADVGHTLQSWVYRVWVLASLLAMTGYLLYRVGPVREFGVLHPASLFMSDLLKWTVLVSVTFVVILTTGSISGERGTMADSVLSRGISRHQYFMGKWHARLVAVLGTFFLLGVVALVSSLIFLHEDLSLTGSLMAMATVAAMLAVVCTAGVTVSAMVHSTMLGMAVLWILLYGLGFAMTQLPPSFPTPYRTLDKLPYILKGQYDAQLLTNLMGYCAMSCVGTAIIGLFYFSRRDV
jgi:putative exporter of polyketide antibiotics